MKEPSVMKSIAVILGAAIYIPSVMVLNGFALSTLWAWFIVATFGVPVLSIPVAIGVCMIAAFLTKQYHKDEREESTVYVYNVLRPLGALGAGYVVKSFM